MIQVCLGLGRLHSRVLGLPLWLSWYRFHLQCRRPGFDPRVGTIPWRRETPPIPVFWSGEFHGLISPWGRKESDKTEQLISLHFREPTDPPRRNPSNRNERHDQWASE